MTSSLLSVITTSVEKYKDRPATSNGLRCGLFRKLLVLTEALFEFSDASTGIEDALLACVERVTD